MKSISYLFSIASLTLSLDNLVAKEQMNWSVVHWPPIMMIEGEDVGKGRFDAYLQLMRKHMPQYQHNMQQMNWSRVWQSMQKGLPICNVLSLKTAQREKIAVFSIPHSITLSNRIIMREATFNALGKPTVLSLTEVMKNRQLKGQIENSRSYTADLDVIIDSNIADSNLTRLTLDPVRMMKMLLVGRFDYLIEYPYIAHYLKTKNAQLPAKIKSVEIKEIKPFSVAYLACPKTLWGLQRIADFDKVVKQLQVTDEYKAIVEMWYVTEQEKQAVRSGYQEMLKMQ